VAIPASEVVDLFDPSHNSRSDLSTMAE